MPAFIRLSCLLCIALCLTACAPMLSFIGTNQTVVQIIAQVERVKLAGDGALYVASSKTITDHALSIVTGADCKIFNVVSTSPVCAARPAKTTVNASAGSAAEPPAQPAVQETIEPVVENSAPSSDHGAGDD